MDQPNHPGHCKRANGNQTTIKPPSPCLTPLIQPGLIIVRLSFLVPFLVLTTTNIIDYRTELNNFLQVNGGHGRLSWQTSHRGPQHELIWTAICYSKCFLTTRNFPPTHPRPAVDEFEYGSASSSTLGDAKERAAHIAHRALIFQAFRQRTGMVA